MITDLLGAPALEDVYHITSPSAVKNLLSQTKPAALAKLYQLAPNTSHGAVHLLSQMLIFNPVSSGGYRVGEDRPLEASVQFHGKPLWSYEQFPFVN